MSDNSFSLWVYLSQSPLLWLTVTLLTYATADAVSLWTHRHPLANPVLHSMWIIGAFLLLTKTSYTTYFGGAQFVHFLLGPATVALGVPTIWFGVLEALEKTPGPAAADVRGRSHRIFSEPRRRKFAGLFQFSGRGSLFASSLGNHGHHHPARRVSDFLHPVPGGNFPGYAASHLRISNFDVSVDGPGSGQRVHV